MNNASEIKFRASSMESLLTNDRSGKSLGDTCKKELLKVYAQVKYGRVEEISSKYLAKGSEREEDAITLLSRLTKRFYKKNTERITNEFITGEPDLYVGESINNAEEILDTKCSWSLLTFLKASNKDYRDQMMCYMALTGAKKATVCYCLVNGTYSAIMNEKRLLGYQDGMMDAAGNPSEEYKKKCAQIEVNHIFDLEAFRNEYPHFEFDSDLEKWTYDIPMEERLFQVVFERNEEEIQRIYDRVMDCRKWMDANLFKVPVMELV